ncbi:26131_t:CDS:2 [Gigaspora margarita]|uniref:26131_t:CDS:1 n=1 Tax=Gigaspora margarita TaxID=4874 RepID=A0ABM8W6K1_GIGMA|nr:26131_t:CDS:2 [Gigaspora margarita]
MDDNQMIQEVEKNLIIQQKITASQVEKHGETLITVKGDSDKPLVKFLHFVETPEKKLKILLNKTYELDTQKVAMLEKSLVTFMKNSGSKAIPDWIKEQAQCKKELESLENKRQREFVEDIVECDKVARIISEIELYQIQLAGYKYLKEDLQKEKKMLQDNRDYLKTQAIASVTSDTNNKFHTLAVLRKQKKIIKQEITEITDQENQKILYEAEYKKMLTSLSEKLESAKEKVNKAKQNKLARLAIIDEQIKKKKEEVKKFEDQILQILEKYGNPSINTTCLLLESIAKQHNQGSGVYTLNRIAVESFLKALEDEINFIRVVEEIQPIIRNSIHGISPKELTEHLARKALEPIFNTNLRIEY